MPKFVVYEGKIMIVLNNLHNYVLSFCYFWQIGVSKPHCFELNFSPILSLQEAYYISAFCFICVSTLQGTEALSWGISQVCLQAYQMTAKAL